MPTAAYVRVSSESQDHATQRDAIERAARARGDEIGAWYAEKASGRTLKRAELDRLRLDARHGRVSRLYVFKLDRLTRSGLVDTVSVVREFQRAGVELVSVTDGFDLTGQAAELIVGVMGWAAEFERMSIAIRTKAARARLEAQGGAWGRPKRMSPIEIDRARGMKTAGRSIREIAQAIKVPRATLARALKTAP